MMARLRRVERKMELPPFRCDLSELGTLIESLKQHFDNPDTRAVSVQISVQNGSEYLAFESVAELMEDSDLPDILDHVDLFASYVNGDRMVVLSFRPNSATVKADSSSEAWNAGATEIALAFARRHEHWYAGFTILVEAFPLALAIALVWHVALGGSWLASIAVGAGGFNLDLWARKRGLCLLPGTQIVVRPQQHWWRAYQAELSTTLGVAAVIIALIAWLFPRH